MNKKIGIIGGSGLDNPEIFSNASDIDIQTPWGKPTSPLKEGLLCGVPVVFLARHGRLHTDPPSQVKYQANIAALKEVGCTHILASTTVGSLREEIQRGDLVILDQFIDFSRNRVLTFFDKSCPQGPVHSAMPDPYDENLRGILVDCVKELGFRHHPKGTVVTIEGPRFSTRAESHMFRAWGADIINMSIATETILANELGIPFAGVAMSTDYDCWKSGEEAVSWDMVRQVFQENVQKMEQLLMAAVKRI